MYLLYNNILIKLHIYKVIQFHYNILVHYLFVWN